MEKSSLPLTFPIKWKNFFGLVTNGQITVTIRHHALFALFLAYLCGFCGDGYGDSTGLW